MYLQHIFCTFAFSMFSSTLFCIKLSNHRCTQFKCSDTDLEGKPASIDVEQPAESTGGICDTNDVLNMDLNASNTIHPPIPSTSTPSPPSLLASAMLTTYASGCPMHVAPKWPTSLHMCCTNKVTQIEIDDGSTVARCTRVGCETVWVCMFFTIILAHPSSNGQCSSTGHAKAWVPMSRQTGYVAPMMDTAV